MKTTAVSITVCMTLLLVIFLAGCNMVQPGFKNIHWELHKQLAPLNLEPVYSCDLGPISLFCTRSLMRRFDNDDEAMGYLENIKRLKIGVYKLDLESRKLPADELENVARNLSNKGWELFVKVRDKNEIVLIFYRQNKQKINGLTVVTCSHQELVAVELHGNLDKIIEKAITERDLEFSHSCGIIDERDDVTYASAQ